MMTKIAAAMTTENERTNTRQDLIMVQALNFDYQPKVPTRISQETDKTKRLGKFKSV